MITVKLTLYTAMYVAAMWAEDHRARELAYTWVLGFAMRHALDQDDDDRAE